MNKFSLLFFPLLALILSACGSQSIEVVAQTESLAQEWGKTTSELTDWINRIEGEILNLHEAEIEIGESLTKHGNENLEVNRLIDSLHSVWAGHEVAYLRLIDKVHLAQLQGSEQLLTLSFTLDQLNADMVSGETAKQELVSSRKLLGSIRDNIAAWGESLNSHKMACRATCDAYGGLVGINTFAALIP